MITLFGATGFTGRRVAQALDRAGLPYRLAGRSAERLAALSARLPARPAWLIADAHDPAPLFSPVPGGAPAGRPVVVNCAGPFTDLGEPVLRLAAMRGVHYLDINNELAYVYRMRSYDTLARQTGAALVPACAFEVAISDCVVATLARGDAAPLGALDIVYAYANPEGVISYGTRLSGLRTYATSWLTYRGGRWQGQWPGAATRRVRLDGRFYGAVSFPSAEVVTVPAHAPVHSVQAWLAVDPFWARPLSALLAGASLLLRTPLGWLTALSFRRLAPPPPEHQRTAFRFALQVELEGRAPVVVRGVDPYALTAEIAAYAAGRLHAGGDQRGLLAPAQALDPAAFVGWLGGQGVTVQTG